MKNLVLDSYRITRLSNLVTKFKPARMVLDSYRITRLSNIFARFNN